MTRGAAGRVPSLHRSGTVPRRDLARVLALLASLLWASGCGRQTPRPVAPPRPGGTTPVAPPPAAPGDPTLRAFLPDPAKTPGDTLAVTARDVCTRGYARKVRDVPSSVKRAAYARYGITHHAPGDYEVDHLISLELGGSNSLRNLWPESYRTQPWNARVKDAVENRLHADVCAGRISLHDAQQAIAHDWIAAYRRYVAAAPGAVGHHRARRRHAGRSTP